MVYLHGRGLVEILYIRGRGLVEILENEEQDENKKMKSIVVDEQEQEQDEGSETRIVDLDEDTLLNVLQRVDVVTLGRAACVNKLWRRVAEDDGLWEPIYIRLLANRGLLGLKDTLLNVLKRVDVVTLGRAACVNKRWPRVALDKSLWHPISRSIRRMIISGIVKPPPDFYSIDFSKKITPWV